MTGSERIYQLALRTFTPEGTFRAAARLLPHVASCGFTHVQLTPVTEADGDPDESHWSIRQQASGTGNPNSNYRLKDYFRIDPEYGTEEDLLLFVKSAHRAGLKVLLDLVYYHCGPNSTLVTDYPDYVQRNEDGSLRTGDWRTPLPNYDNPKLCEYLWDNMTYFVEKFDVDGYRCDVGDRVPLFFWEEGVRRCRELKPDFFMVCEGGKLDYLSVFDCAYFWDGCFESPKIAKGEMDADTWAAKWKACREALPKEGGRMLHYLDNHDICSDAYDERLEKMLGHAAMEVQHVLIHTLDGTPFFFNGNELADALKHNLFSNRFHGKDPAVQWENLATEEGQHRMELTQTLNALRDEYEALNSKELTWVETNCPKEVLAYIRPGKEESIFVLLNLRNRPLTVKTAFRAPLHDELLAEGVRATETKDGTEIQMLGYGYWVIAY